MASGPTRLRECQFAEEHEEKEGEVTYVVSMMRVNSSASSARPYIQKSSKFQSWIRHWGLSRQARKKDADVDASHRDREAVQ